MAIPTDTRTLNTLSATTERHLIPKLINQVIYSTPLTMRMLSKSETVGGGTQIEQPLEYGEEDVQWMSEYGNVNFSVKEIATLAKYEWRNLNGPIAISEKQMDVQNTSKEQRINMVTAKTKNLSRSFKKGFSEALFKGSAAGANEPPNFYDIIENNTGSLGGLSGSSYNWWQAKKLDLSSQGLTWDNIADPTHTYYIEKIFRYVYGAMTNGDQHPTIMVTSQELFDLYEESLHSQNRFASQRKVQAGFEMLRFRQADVMVDTDCPAGDIYFINEEFVGFKHHPSFNFKFTPFKRLEQQHLYVAELDWYGSLVCSNRAYQGMVTGLPTSTLTSNISGL